MTQNGRNRDGILSSRVATIIALTVTAVWAASFIADFMVKDYDPNPLVHFIMMGVAGAVFGHGFLKNGKNGNGNGGGNK